MGSFKMIEGYRLNFKKTTSLLVIPVLALTVALTGLLTLTTFAQILSSPRGLISVVGEGIVMADPDTAMTTLGLTITAPTLEEATSEADERMQNIIGKLQELGIAHDDIQTVSYHISPRSNPSRGDESPKIVGYHVSNQVQVKIRNIDEVGEVIDGLIAAGANSVSGISFTVDDPIPYRSRARTLAVKDVMNKAGELAGAAGVKLGKIISLTELDSSRPIVLERTSTLRSSPSIQTGQLEIGVRVEMHFEIEQ